MLVSKYLTYYMHTHVLQNPTLIVENLLNVVIAS